MKIDVRSIPESGLELKEAIAASDLDIERQGTKFKSPIEVTAKVQKEDKEILIEVFIEATMNEGCTRCLSEFEAPLDKHLYLSYEASSQEVIDLSKDIREEIMLNYSMKPLCNKDCKGLCHICGQNLNEKECGCDRSFKDWDK